MISPKGPAREQFDAFFAKASESGGIDELNDENLLLLWSDILIMWLYDASEKVEDWWSKWEHGILRDLDSEPKAETQIYVDRNVSHK